MIIEPGKYLSGMFSEDMIKKYVLENYEVCYNKQYNNKGKCRLSYKLVLDSSEGTICTKWFKMGYMNLHWKIYPFMWKNDN